MTRILIIEDDTVIRKQIVDFLKFENYDTIEAEDGQKGVEKAISIVPDLIICDIMMPGMDGFEVLRILRNYQKTSTIPFIFLTARAEDENLREGMNLGADDYLVKPIKFEDLLKAIQSRLKKHQIMVEKFNQKVEQIQNNIIISFPHEFRTPLNAILGYSQILLDNAKENQDSELEVIAQSIYNSGKRLLRLVSNFNEYVNINNLSKEDKLLLKNSKTTYHDILKDTCNQVSERYNKIQDLIFSLESDTFIKINEHYLQKIVEEIFDNACKFSFPNTPIKIESFILGNNLLLAFTNYGITFTKEQIDMIDTFIQFNRSKFEQQGIGLGLALVKSILQVFDGKLELQSDVNAPTVVKVYLPLALN